jgi:hypothetical protein
VSKRRVAGNVHVDSAQILILDPGRLTEWQYNSVIDTPRVENTAEVWLEESVTVENFLDPPKRTNDGVVVDTGSDGSFSVQVEYGDHGFVTSIRIDLE